MIKTRIALAAAAIALSCLSGPAFADGTTDMGQFIKMCDTNKDGMVSREEFMKHVEKVWAKMDQKKADKMDARQFELFLRALMKSEG